jgi:hypothetical protein
MSMFNKTSDDLVNALKTMKAQRGKFTFFYVIDMGALF